jgi:Flp pilus assembly protein CpaB
MSPVAPRRPGAPSTFSVPVIALIAVSALVVVFGALMALGVVDFSRFRSQEPSTAGLVAVPTAAAIIPAYTRVQRDHLWDRTRSRIAVIYLPPRAVTPEMLTNIGQVIGRVLDHDKAPGYVFTETDFLPPGTREGIVGGIPAGKRAVRIAADKVDGLFGLRPGDRFDVLATLPIDANSGGRSLNVGGPYGQELAIQAQLSNWSKQATVRVIVQNATIVEPIKTRGVPIFQTSLSEGAALRTRPVQEAVIAVDPDEVAPLTEALAVDATLTTVPRSGRPDDPPNSKTPDSRPFSPFTTPGAAAGSQGFGGARDSASFTMVETIMGQRRSLSAVPRR